MLSSQNLSEIQPFCVILIKGVITLITERSYTQTTVVSILFLMMGLADRVSRYFHHCEEHISIIYITT